MLLMACSYPCDPEVHAGTPKDVEGVIGNVLLTLPFYKHIFAWMGAHPAGIIPHNFPSFTDQAFQTTAFLYIANVKGWRCR